MYNVQFRNSHLEIIRMQCKIGFQCVLPRAMSIFQKIGSFVYFRASGIYKRRLFIKYLFGERRAKSGGTTAAVFE